MFSLTDIWTNRHVGQPALVIGNGKSRNAYDLKELETYGFLTIGCNALHRDFDPDYLVCKDYGIVKEVKESYCGHGTVIAYDTYALSEYRTSGGAALDLALIMGCNPVYLIGFEANSSNIYEGTPNYPLGSHGEALIKNIVEEILEIPKKYPNQRVVQVDAGTHSDNTISYQDLIRRFSHA